MVTTIVDAIEDISLFSHIQHCVGVPLANEARLNHKRRKEELANRVVNKKAKIPHFVCKFCIKLFFVLGSGDQVTLAKA